MIGAGRYDDIVTELRERLNAQGIILVVLNGNRGQGVSQQLAVTPAQLPVMTALLAGILEDVAKNMRREVNEVLHPKSKA